MRGQESLIYWYWVDLDPMGPDFSPDRFLAARSQNGIGRKQGHMAVDAVFRNLLAHCLVHPASRYLVTLQAAAGIGGRIVFRSMDFVAGTAGHVCRREKAAASLEQPDLVAVNVGPGGVIHRVRLQVAAQQLPGQVREGGP